MKIDYKNQITIITTIITTTTTMTTTLTLTKNKKHISMTIK